MLMAFSLMNITMTLAVRSYSYCCVCERTFFGYLHARYTAKRHET
jgi:hypothetical protein